MSDTLLILDLDETLIHATEKPLARESDFRVSGYFVYKRPHVDAFLATVARTFELAVWTSSGEVYAHRVIGELFGELATRLAFVWCSDRCTQRFDGETFERYVVKDLKKLKRRGYDLNRVIVLDDTPSKHERNFGNLVPVSEYAGDPGDDELLRVLPFLDWLRAQPSIRDVEKRSWRTRTDGDPIR